MKILQIFFLSAVTTVFLAACNPPTPPVVVEPTTFDLGINVTGVPGAPVKVLNAAGEIKFDATVTGSKTLSALPKGKYIVTGGAVANFAAPAAQTADLGGGNGTVTLGYTAAAGQALALDKIQGTLSDPQAPGNTLNVFLGDINSVLASSKVGADGSVSVSLTAPPLASLSPFLPPAGSSCSYTGTLNAGKVFATDNVRLNGSQGDAIGAVIERPVGGSNTASVLHAYADIAQNDQGTVACFGSPPVKLNVRLLPGWNALIVDKDAGGTITVVTAPSDTRVQLVLDKFPANVSIVLDTPSLTLKAGESVTVNATIFQRGGLSGKIDLSTDILGVSVEPASVTLPVLSTQSVQSPSFLIALSTNISAQSLTTPLTLKVAADVPRFSGTMNLIAKQAGKVVGQGDINVNLVVPAVTATIQYGQGITIARGQVLPVNIQSYGTDGYKGIAQISLEGLPAGVTASTGQVTFLGQNNFEGQDLQLTLTASAIAQTGTTQAQLVVTASGRMTKSPVNILIPTPAINVTYPNTYGSPVSVSGYQGETISLPISVKSVNGFTGSTTLTLTGLPAGITAVPLTVNLQPDVEFRANIQIVIAQDAAFGPVILTMNGDGLAADNGYSNITKINLIVNISRTASPTIFSYSASAPGGFWTLNDSQYVNGGYVRTLTRFQNKQSVYNREIPVSYWVSGMLSTSGGDLIIVSTESITMVTQAGVVSSVAIVNGPPSGPFVVDGQNRVWFSQYDSVKGSYWLTTLDPMTGSRQQILDLGTSYNTPALYVDNVGANIYATGITTDVVTKINVATQARKDIGLPGSLSVASLAVTNDGTIWGSQYTGGVFKINTDGSASVYSSLPVGGRLFFDRADANTLWLADINGYTSAVHKINTVTLTDTVSPIGNHVRNLIQDVSGGAWAITLDNSTSYFSQLK